MSFSSGLWSVATGSVMAPAGRANNVATRVRVTSLLGAETQRSGSTPGSDPNLGDLFSRALNATPSDHRGGQRRLGTAHNGRTQTVGPHTTIPNTTTASTPQRHGLGTGLRITTDTTLPEPYRVSRRVFYLTPASGAGVCSR